MANLSALLVLLPCCTMSLIFPFKNIHSRSVPFVGRAVATRRWMAYGDFTVELEKPLGIILEERTSSGEGGGVRVESLVEGGNADSGGYVVPGDILVQVGETDVSGATFDSVMDLLVSVESPVLLTVGDGLGSMDIAANLSKRLEVKEAIYTDAVVRAAVRELRRDGRLGDLLNVEIVIGAGFRDNGERCLVRFFAIFSTDGLITTYSCNVSATGVRRSDDSIDIVALSCAKDEGLGQTIDIILEKD